MASPNDISFQPALEKDESNTPKKRQVVIKNGVRNPFDILVKWAKHPILYALHKKGWYPYLIFGHGIVLLEYSLKNKKGGQYYFRIWEEFFEGSVSSERDLTSFVVEYNGNDFPLSGTPFFLDMKKELKQGSVSYPTTHKISLNNIREHASSHGYWHFKVNPELKLRSEIVMEIFELAAKTKDHAIPNLKAKCATILEDLIDPNQRDRWDY